jgi:hypothetical protein
VVSQITLSEKSRKLIEQVERNDASLIPNEIKHASHVDRALLIVWLREQQSADKKTRFLQELLSVSILNDIYQSLSQSKSEEVEKKAGWLAKTKFFFLAIAGVIYCACEGFDGITAILSATALSPMFIFLGGLIFSVLSILVFFAFDLVEISKNLGVNIKNTSKVVDIYLQEIELIKNLRKTIDANFSDKTSEDLKSDLDLLAMLIGRYAMLADARQSLKRAHEHPYLKIAKFLTAGVSGILFFSAGYFAGQTVALAIAGLFLASVTPAFWPIVLVSIGVGLTALSVYWFVQRPGIENLISRWAGLDKDKIDKLCDDEEVKREEGKLSRLHDKVTVHYNDRVKLSSALRDISSLKAQLSSKEIPALGESSSSVYNLLESPKLSRTPSYNSFFQKASNESSVIPPRSNYAAYTSE